MQIHDQQVRTFARRDLDRLLPVGSLEHLEVGPFEEQLHQHARDRLVIGDQHARSRAGSLLERVEVLGQDPIDLLDGGDALAHEPHRMVAHVGSAGGSHRRADFMGGRAPNDRVAKLFRGREQFGDRDAPHVTGVLAVVAARTSRCGYGRQMMFGAQPKGLRFTVRLPAVGAQRPQEPLRQHGRQALGDLEGFEPEVREPGDCRGGVYRVQRAEDEVPCVSGLSHNLCDLRIADLADHDDVGILPEEGAKHGRERIARAAVHGNLCDARHRTLHRILDADDVRAPRPEVPERGVEGRGLAGAGGTRDQNQTVRPCQRPFEPQQRVGVVSKAVERLQGAMAVDDPHDQLFPVHGGHAREPDVDTPAVHIDPEGPVLRLVPDGNVRAPQDLESVSNGL